VQIAGRLARDDQNLRHSPPARGRQASAPCA
jgi:hypothetical protein